MKKLFIIGGPMGVGKTAICQNMKNKLDNCVFLDGDWCWDAHPFLVTEETKKMVTDNICFLLNQFIHCSAYKNIVFCWVMHEQSIIDTILARLDTTDCKVHTISLICSPDTLVSRLKKDISTGIRSDDVIERSLNRLSSFNELNTAKIQTDNRSIDQIADIIRSL